MHRPVIISRNKITNAISTIIDGVCHYVHETVSLLKRKVSTLYKGKDVKINFQELIIGRLQLLPSRSETALTEKK